MCRFVPLTPTHALRESAERRTLPPLAPSQSTWYCVNEAESPWMALIFRVFDRPIEDNLAVGKVELPTVT